IVGTLIGTGIFASPGPLFESVHCTQTSFIIWAFAGVVCTIGAFAYAELGTMFPASGGDFQYLRRAYGKKVAWVFGWSFITILNPIGTAGIAGVLGRYAVDLIAPLPPNHTPPAQQQHADTMPWLIRGFSIGAIVLMGLINIFFREGGKYASNLLAIFKIGGMCMLIVIGSMQAVKNHAQSEALQIPIRESSQNVLDYVSALCFAFFAYNGFNNINLGLGELRDPERNLKRAVFIAMPFVTILFLLANFAFFSILSSYDLRHVHSLSLHAGHTVLGQPGGFLMAGTVVASALGSINANLWAGSRLLVIMAKDNTIIPFPIARVWSRTGTQAIAILILVGQASFHSLINLDFKTFSKIYSAVGWTWYGLSVAGLLYLRKKRPNYPRPVKVFWPLAAFFVVIAAVLVIGSL
ncbi:amino acid/polyamine transporter I, partial [Linnemannia elongata]